MGAYERFMQTEFWGRPRPRARNQNVRGRKWAESGRF